MKTDITGLRMHRRGVAAIEPDAAARRVIVTCTTSTPDRVGDSVEPSGLDLKAYRNNPVVLWNHDHDKPIAKCLEIDQVGDGLKAAIEFPPEGEVDEADRVYRLIKNGIVNAISIGFRVLKATARDGKDAKKGLAIAQSELYEISVVAVGANPDALIEERAMIIKGLTMVDKTAKPTTVKGLWEVSNLARLLADFSWLEDCVEWEAEYEADGSDIPRRLAEVMATLGQVLIDMTIEEVTELTRAEATEDEAKAFLGGKVKSAIAAKRATVEKPTIEKSGKVLSKASRGTIEDACKSILSGHDMLVAMLGDGADEGDAEPDMDEKSAEDILRRTRIATVKRLSAPR